jgi:hypothetical protein
MADIVERRPRTTWRRTSDRRRRDLQEPNKARSLQPGATGFLFTVNPRHEDKAKNEALALLSHYLDKVLLEDDEAGDASGEPSKTVRPRPEAESGVAMALAAELSAVRGGRSVRYHPLLRAIETKVKGYMFISLSLPDDEPTDESTTAPVPQEPEGVVDPAADPRGIMPTENRLVGAVADAMWMDLTARPRAVARFTYRCYPIGCSCVPTRSDFVAGAAEALASSWFVETRPNEATPPAAVWVSVTVRNNSKMEAVRDALKLDVARALPTDRFLYQPTYIPKAAVAIAATGRLTLHVSVIVCHSVALISVQPHLEQRFEYNLSAVTTVAAAQMTDQAECSGLVTAETS